MRVYRIHRSPRRRVGWEIDHVVDDGLTFLVGAARTVRAAVRKVRRDARAATEPDGDPEVTVIVPTTGRKGA